MSKFSLRALLLVFSFIFMGANQHFNTSINPKTGIIKLQLDNNIKLVKLDSPNTQYEKYPDGSLKLLKFNSINIIYELTFHPKIFVSKERIASIKRFQQDGNRIYLQGPTQTFNQAGQLMTETNWNDGVLNGRQIIYNSHSLTEERFFSHGFPIKTWRLYYTNGNKAQEITFPDNFETWLTSEISGPIPNSSNLALTTFAHPIKIKELYFTPQGQVKREHTHFMFKKENSLFIANRYQAQVYNTSGKIYLRETQNFGTKKQSREITSFGTTYFHNQFWFSNKLFKTTHYTLPTQH